MTVTQRFGSALNLNPHFHSLALDGVYHRPTPGGPLVFAPRHELTDATVVDVLQVFRHKLAKVLSARGYGDSEPEDHEDQPTAMRQLSLSALRMAAKPSRAPDDIASKAWPRRPR